MKWRQLAERQIQKARAEGQLDQLKGEGRPLPPPVHGDFAEEAGFRIMKEAGVLPEEIALRKAIPEAARAVGQARDPDEKKAAFARLGELQQRLAVVEEARRKFMSSR